MTMKFIALTFAAFTGTAFATNEQEDAPINDEVVETITHEFSGRELRYARNKIAWPECVEEGMTVDECHALIEKEIGIGHVLPNVTYEKRFPPPLDSAADTMFSANDYYYRFAVATNYLSQVQGYAIDGQITYDHQWNGIRSGPRDIGPWDCMGESPVNCCSAIKRDVRDRDKNNKYIDCWVHQQEPIPYHKGGRISYCAWVYDKNTQSFEPTEASVSRQRLVQERAKEEMIKVAKELQGFLDNDGVPYNSLSVVSRNLHFHGRSLEHVQKAAADMDGYLHRPNLPGDILPVDATMKELLEWTINAIKKFNDAPHEIPHHIVVHSGDHTGSFVMHVPRIGTEPGQPECVP